MSELFRREAVEHARRRLTGSVSLALPLSTSLLGLFLAGIVLAALIFASLATYARKETVQGWITTPGGLLRVQARQGGVVQAVDVRAGQKVQAGEHLATLSGSIETARGGAPALITRDISVQRQAELKEGTARLAALDLEVSRIKDSLEIGRRELIEIDRRIALQQSQVELAQNVVDQSRSLAEKGYLPQRELNARISASLTAEEYLAQLRSQRLALERQVAESRSRLATLPSDREILVANASSAAAQLNQRETDVGIQGEHLIGAPAAGRVEDVTVRRGQTLSPGDTVAVLSPGSGSLEVELFIPARAVGFVKPGQSVRLMFAAFPYQKFGSGNGRVLSISSTALAPAELSGALVAVQEPVYRARVALDRNFISAYGRHVPLRSGMQLSADIIIDRRSLLEWLLDPLYAAGRRR